MILDHIGIVVKELSAGITQWQKQFGYYQLTDPVVNSRQHVQVVFLAKEESTTVKLVQPVDDLSSVYIFARKGGGLHHLCFRCRDLSAELCRLESTGIRMLTAPQTGEAFCNENIAFVYAGNGLNIELIDTVRKAKMI